MSEHIRLYDTGKTFDSGAVEADPLLERFFKLSGCDSDGFEGADNVGKPQTYVANILLLDGVENMLLLTVHIVPFVKNYLARSSALRLIYREVAVRYPA